MADWLLVAVRLALYLDLGLAFGWAMFCLYALPSAEAARLLPQATPVALLGLLGLPLAIFAFIVLVAAMAGLTPGSVGPDLLETVLRETAVGWAFAARLASLLLLCMAGLLIPRGGRLALAAAAAVSAVALASLAWSGHAAAAEGNLASVRLAADILHLLCAGLWLGALAGFVWLVAGPRASAERLRGAQAALARFAPIGSAIVAMLIATGLVNTIALARPAGPASIVASQWGQLLLIKLVLFLVMLALAATNRFRLAPRLARALERDDAPAAVRRLRLSLATELAAATAILALVAWLGTLPPPAAG